MTESDIRRLMVALARIEVSIEALREENQFGQKQHEDYEQRLRVLEHEVRVDPAEVREGLRGADRARWVLYGIALGLGGLGGAGLTEWLGG